MSKFSGFLEFDGKFVHTGTYKNKIPFIYAIDFFTHDIPHGMLVPSENYLACRKFFSDLKSINYPLKYLVCDDNNNIKLAAIDIYPDVVIQTCTKHFLESIRDTLNTKTCNKYLPFVIDVESIFTLRLASWELVWKIQDIYNKYNNDPKTMFWMSEIIRRKEELTNYHMFIDAPNTTNLIEVYNSHLEGRLKTIKGFESFHSARRWLNAYIIKRRTHFKMQSI